MKNPVNVLLLLLLFSVSCNSSSIESKENTSAKIIDFKTFNRDVKSVSDVVGNIQIVKSNSSNTVNISLIRKILTKGDKIFLVQYGRGRDEVYCFNFNGDLIYTINGIGEGPLEYREIEDVYFDISQQYLVLLDRPTRKRIYFKLDGEPVKEDYNLRSVYLDETHALGDLYYSMNGLASPGNQRLLVTDEDGQIVSSHMNHDPVLDDVQFAGDNRISRKNDQQINFTSGRREVIYAYDLDSGIVKEDYQINFDNKMVLEENMPLIETINLMVDNPTHRFLPSNIYQNPVYLKFTFIENYQFQQAFVNKNTLDLVLPERLENDLFNSEIDQVMGVTEEGKFIVRIKPDETLLEKGLFVDAALNEQFGTRAEDISDPEDPILVVFDLKF